MVYGLLAILAVSLLLSAYLGYVVTHLKNVIVCRDEHLAIMRDKQRDLMNTIGDLSEHQVKRDEHGRFVKG